jgi:hypothetical protein
LIPVASSFSVCIESSGGLLPGIFQFGGTLRFDVIVDLFIVVILFF